MSRVLLSERRDSVLILTLNRPEKLNALSNPLIEALSSALDEAETDAGVRGLVITGAGRAFCAGADIAGFAPSVRAGPEAAVRDFVRPGQNLTRRIEGFRKPIIAAVNGLAFGGGCEIIEAMHLAIASDRATFSKAEIDIGIIPVFGGTQRLPRHVGRKLAYEMILAGRAIGAVQAAEHGLVNRVVPAGTELSAAIELALEISSKSQAAVSAAMQAISGGLNAPIDEGLRIEADAFARLVAAPGAHEGISAFLSRGPRPGS